jgi:hypothetical protein
MPHSFERDVGREQEELNRHQLLRALLRGMGEEPVPGEAPDDHEAGKAFDCGVDPESDQGDRAGQDAGGDRDAASPNSGSQTRSDRQQPTAKEPRNLLCAYLAGAVFLGLAGNALFGWWWLDPIAALLVAGIGVKEGLQTWRGEGCCAAPDFTPIHRLRRRVLRRVPTRWSTTSAARPFAS